ncbi:MAG TPA: class I tRNA ligase family protein, partial [Sphingomicrobium sp.]
ASDSIAAPAAELPVNRWIIGEVVETLAKLDRAFDELRFDDMADAIYQFVWGTFCDWYVELVKGFLPSPSGEGKSGEAAKGRGSTSSDPPAPNPSPEGEGSEETRRVAAWAFDQILVMLHPLMPFITEELWHAMGERPYELIVAKWPEPQALVDRQAKAELEWLVRLISEIRSTRTELNVPAGAKLELLIETTDEALGGRLDRHASALQRLGRISSMRVPIMGIGAHVGGVNVGSFESLDLVRGKGAAQLVVDEVTYILPLESVIDVDSEKTRLDKVAAAAEKERDSLAQRLANPNFTERAKPEAVEKARADHEAKAAEAERLRAALERLG